MLRSVIDAEDVLQDTFLKLVRHLQSGGSRENLRSWLFTVAANDCRSRLRGRYRWIPWTPETDRRTAPDVGRTRCPGWRCARCERCAHGIACCFRCVRRGSHTATWP
jgi:hypothetical protein